MIKNGQFNAIYSSFLLESKAIMATPERPEDVHAIWKTYTENDIDALTAAAEGTPWCIAGLDVARVYTAEGGVSPTPPV